VTAIVNFDFIIAIGCKLLDSKIDMSGVFFHAKYPLIGTKHKRSSLHMQQQSPYYWWWAYLRRNEEYVACCAAGGAGKLAWLYEDFGDVRSDDFPAWWGGSQKRGRNLFSEQASTTLMAEIKDIAKWDSLKTKGQFVLLAFNMDIGRRKLQAKLATFLADNHKGKRGRRALGSAKSTARYPLHRNYSQHNLRVMLETYDAWYANQQMPKEERLYLWQIGESIKLVPTAMTLKKDTQAERTNKRNVMTMAVSRYVRQAKRIIANTAKGEFPNSIA
jgi:hypothetical protein